MVRWLWRRWPRVALVCLWMMDVTTVLSTRWDSAALVTNGFWAWPTSHVYHVGLWLLVLFLFAVEER